MKMVNIGVDVGNYDVKTTLTTTPNGFNHFESLPFGAREYVFYKNAYYVPSERRFPYVKDKTSTDNAFILTLMAIGKEILARCEKKDQKEIQEEIDDIGIVNLCGGLPPAHMHLLKKKTIEYYRRRFGNGITFKVNGYTFNLKLGLCEVVPQDYAAIATVIGNGENERIPNKFHEYYAIDIGGATVDVVPVRNNIPIVEECISLNFGVLLLYDKIMSEVERDFGITLSQTNIEDMLRDVDTIIDKEIIDRTNRLACEWLNMILETLTQKGLNFQTVSSVFIGGGALLFRHYIAENRIVKNFEFLGGAKGNATGYTKYIEAVVKEKR